MCFGNDFFYYEITELRDAEEGSPKVLSVPLNFIENS